MFYDNDEQLRLRITVEQDTSMISIAYIVKNEADALNANFSNTYR
jgi:hypothetical protein